MEATEQGNNWQDWTSCQMYGHLFEEGWCRDCGEKQE